MGEFVGYFDRIRKISHSSSLVDRKIAQIINKRINSITISNKKMVDGGLELADIAAYSTYRKLSGDPAGRVKIQSHHITNLHNSFRKKTYLKSLSGSKLGIKELS